MHHLKSDEEDPVDILPQLREECKKGCDGPQKAYDLCTKRIETKGEGDCEAWYFDLIHCVDVCVAPKAFNHTK